MAKIIKVGKYQVKKISISKTIKVDAIVKTIKNIKRWLKKR